MRLLSPPLILVGLVACSACGDGKATGTGGGPAIAQETKPERVAPPFNVEGELDGLVLVWFDQDGPHTATSRAEIPEAHREHVRVDSLAIAPDKKLDSQFIYLADVRKPVDGPNYPVFKYPREWLEKRLSGATPAEGAGAAPAAVAADEGVILYSASWCGACRKTREYLSARSVGFVEKDIERDRVANGEMLRKLSAAGLTPSGIPVVDFHGTLVQGFSAGKLGRLIEARATQTI